MSAVTITVLDAAGTPQQFTSEPDAERWVYIPRGTRPGEPWFSECEVQSQCNYGCCKYGQGGNKPCISVGVWWEDESWQARIRPTGGRDWSAIAPKPDYSEWTEVTAETKPEDFSLEKYELEVNAKSNDKNQLGWRRGLDSDVGLDWLGLDYRIRRRKPQPEPQPEVPMCEKCVPELLGESDGDFAIRMLRGCYTRATLYRGGAAWMQRGKVEISLADALRLAAMIGGVK